jgi:hypothetical protein
MPKPRIVDLAPEYAQHELDELFAIVGLLADGADQALRTATGIAGPPLPKRSASRCCSIAVLSARDHQCGSYHDGE